MSYPSDVSIVNGALAKLGAKLIVSLDDQCQEARLSKARLKDLKRDLLRQHGWKFAIQTATLAQVSSYVGVTYGNAFQLPTDFIAIHNISVCDYERQGDLIATNDSGVALEYVADVGVDKYTPDFCELLSIKLAEDLAIPLTQSTTNKQVFNAQFDAKIRTVRHFDGVERTPQRVNATLWRNSRYRGR